MTYDHVRCTCGHPRRFHLRGGICCTPSALECGCERFEDEDDGACVNDENGRLIYVTESGDVIYSRKER